MSQEGNPWGGKERQPERKKGRVGSFTSVEEWMERLRGNGEGNLRNDCAGKICTEPLESVYRASQLVVSMFELQRQNNTEVNTNFNLQIE